MSELLHGDCFDIMSKMETGSVDHVITDPPYSDWTHRNAKTNKSKGGSGIKLIHFPGWSEGRFLGFVAECVRVADRWTIMTCEHRFAPKAEEGGLPVIRLGVWVKTNPMPQISGDRPGQGHESVLILHRPTRKRWNGGGRSAVWTTNSTNSASIPTEKPLSLICKFIEDFTDPGETILDPCMGSGTVGVACKRLGREFIGIEILGDHFEIARKRIENEHLQGEMFW